MRFAVCLTATLAIVFSVQPVHKSCNVSTPQPFVWIQSSTFTKTKQNKKGYGSYLSRTFLLQPLRSHATCTNDEYCSLRCLKKKKIAGNNVQQLAVLTSFTRKDAK